MKINSKALIFSMVMINTFSLIYAHTDTLNGCIDQVTSTTTKHERARTWLSNHKESLFVGVACLVIGGLMVKGYDAFKLNKQQNDLKAIHAQEEKRVDLKSVLVSQSSEELEESAVENYCLNYVSMSGPDYFDHIPCNKFRDLPWSKERKKKLLTQITKKVIDRMPPEKMGRLKEICELTANGSNHHLYYRHADLLFKEIYEDECRAIIDNKLSEYNSRKNESDVANS